MEILIGITQSGRELSFETNDTAHAVRTAVTEALSAGSAHLELSDDKGATYILPTASIAYVQLGSDQARRVGFVA